MSSINYKVEAFWDSETEVWVATSDDVSGLVTEAENIERLTEKIRVMIPELLSLNGVINSQENNEIQWELITHRQELIEISS
jgi:hypothetical protein